MKQRSRTLRREQTDAEKAMWRLLRDRQLNDAKFRRQHVIDDYILDFYCHTAKLAIELDGNQHVEPAQMKYDELRTRALAEEGIRLLRFSNHDVLLNPSGVLAAIAEALESRLD